MKISVILAHPSKASFNHSIAESATDELRRNNHKIFYHDLYDEKFDPILRTNEIAKDVVLPEGIGKLCEEITQSDGIIVIHPNRQESQEEKEVKLPTHHAAPIHADQPCILIRNAPLDEHTTFRVPARAAWLADVRDSSVLPELLAMPKAKDLPVLVLGGGSNVLFTRDFEGLIIRLATHGIKILASDPEHALVRVAAGEDWDGFVRWSLEQGFSGLENLIMIPGAVGAAPIQNIGAYGVEVREFVATVEAWDRVTREIVRLGNETCAFGYRNSLFKRQRQRYVVTAVELRLPKQRPLRLDYSGVRQELAAMGVNTPTPMEVGQAVERLRRRKLPDPALIGNAGSFFKNPLISIEQAKALSQHHPDLPVYPYSENYCKISAAWLIEVCGFKGFREGDAGVSEMHSLVLVNYGAASGAQLWALAVRIRDTVAARFGVNLEPEPLVL